mmetsp:Transcript_4209/g.5921  ORF Transcript_4209/g.5921 Transcript_4209/m.5921 type:complete len:205 (-) Transcript_4209:315-929(-)|eukprot:CAMPEP_0197291042 /NCGR_PEP_ID=MMETSP0890-20130614/11443_1 /TAXON_ID=44058 ORGANISM="Aureoumbra lagunensis, Strain CCMP1510" /NCGR_SAMPLE_ID=MMETSP0890 /ASSEMBLY_ACC=CAM_ASM_000533 /LENGTH=204 /DNA_ID=CAMNT_0042763557 /DNA_START=79 /DNA_END=693 /DNA_ORIENTATION=+
MISKVILVAFSIGASAFQAPSQVQNRGKPLQVSLDEVKDDSGVSLPFGFFDPAGFVETDAQLEQYSLYKESEIKHGRVAMLAAPGFLLAEKFHPLFGGDIDTPSYVAFQQTPLQKFWPFVVAAIGFIEFKSSVPTYEDPDKEMWSIKPDHTPGNLGFDPLGLMPKDAAGAKAVATREINNGRLAMIGIAGMIAQELVTGTKIFA